MLYTVSTKELVKQLKIKSYLSESLNLSKSQLDILLNNPEMIEDLDNSESVKEFIQHTLSFPKRTPVSLSFDKEISVTQNMNILLAAIHNQNESLLVNISEYFPSEILKKLNAQLEENQTPNTDYLSDFDWEAPDLSIDPIPLSDEEVIFSKLANQKNDTDFFKSIDQKLYKNSDFLLKATEINQFVFNYVMENNLASNKLLLDTFKDNIDILSILWRKRFKQEYLYSQEDVLSLLAQDYDINSLRESVWDDSRYFKSEKEIAEYEKQMSKLFNALNKERTEYHSKNIEKAKVIKQFYDEHIFNHPDKTLLFINKVKNDDANFFDIKPYLNILPKATLEDKNIFSIVLSKLPAHDEEIAEFVLKSKPELFKDISPKDKLF